ncbi:MAG: hypothetical protein RTU92_01490 [Candidatus Thorarchaeota archaeon]
MNQAILLGFLAGFLNIASIILGLVLLIPTLAWILRTNREIKSYTDVDDWLEIYPSLKLAGDARESLRKMSIWSIRNQSRRRRGVVVSLLVALILMTSWLVWETWPYQQYEKTITNDDIRVFDQVGVNPDLRQLDICGSNTILLDTRRCRVHYFIPYFPDSDGTPTVTSTWNLTYRLSAGILGSVSLTVEYWIYDYEGDSLMNVAVHSVTVSSSVVENSVVQCINGSFHYTCFSVVEYKVGVVLSAWLTGFSSIESNLKILNLTVTE